MLYGWYTIKNIICMLQKFIKKPRAIEYQRYLSHIMTILFICMDDV